MMSEVLRSNVHKRSRKEIARRLAEALEERTEIVFAYRSRRDYPF